MKVKLQYLLFCSLVIGWHAKASQEELTVTRIVELFNQHLSEPNYVEQYLLNDHMGQLAETFFTDSRMFDSILKEGGKFTEKIKDIFTKYWDKKITAIMASEDKEEAFRGVYSSMSPVMKKFLEARILQLKYDKELGGLGIEIKDNFSNIFNFEGQRKINASIEFLKTVYNFVGVEEVNELLLEIPTRQKVEQCIEEGNLNTLVADIGLDSPFKSLLQKYYQQEVRKIVESTNSDQEKLKALQDFYGKQNWNLGVEVLKKELLVFYNESFKEFISTGTGKESPIRAFCEKKLDLKILGDSVLESMKDLLRTLSLSADLSWRNRFFDFILTSKARFIPDDGSRLLIEFLNLNQGTSFVGNGRDDVNDIYQLYSQRASLAEKVLFDPVVLEKVGILIDGDKLNSFLVGRNRWMRFERVVKEYYIQKIQNFSEDELSQELNKLSWSPRAKIFSEAIVEKTKKSLLDRLYSKDAPNEEELIKLFDDIVKSPIFTDDWKFEFSKIPRDSRISLIYAMQVMQGKAEALKGLESSLMNKELFIKYPRFWFVLVNKSMESQDVNVQELKLIWLQSLSEKKDSYSLLKISPEKQGFLKSLKKRCVSWLKAWPIRKKYKNSKSDSDRFAEAIQFAKGNVIMRTLNEQEKLTSEALLNYREKPEDVCREIGVILSKSSGDGVTFAQLRELLDQLASIKDITRAMIDDEIVKRVPKKMQGFFNQEIQNLSDEQDAYNLTLKTTRDYVDVLSQLKERPEKRIDVVNVEGSEKATDDKSSDYLKTSTSSLMQLDAQKKAEEAFEKQRGLEERAKTLKDTKILTEGLVEARRG